jgi:hypothetical protein
MQDHLVVKAGPNDMLVLYIQDQHCSDDIWSEEVK